MDDKNLGAHDAKLLADCSKGLFSKTKVVLRDHNQSTRLLLFFLKLKSFVLGYCLVQYF